MPSLIPGPPVAVPICIRLDIPNLESTVHLVPRPAWPTLTQLLGGATAAAYLLIDARSDERRIRPGETQDIAQRLVRHAADPAMRWAGVAIVICGPCIDKGMAVALQESLEIYLRTRATVRLMVYAPAPTPRIGEDAWQRVARLTRNVLAALPRLGVVVNPDPPRDRLEGVRIAEQVIDAADIEESYTFEARGIEAAVAKIGDDYYVLAGSEIRDRPAECARVRHKDVRGELAATRRLHASYAPGRVRIASPIWVSSLDAAGKMIVGDRHRYAKSWVQTAPSDLPLACRELLAGQIDAAAAGRRL